MDCTWSCNGVSSWRTSIFYLPKETSIFVSGTPKFLPVTENFLVYQG